MTVEIRRGSARFVEREVGRVTRHAFSFGSDYDPDRVSFGPMVCHDDHLLGPGLGFDTHRHSGLEIVTYVVSGSLRHTDSSGSSGSTTVVPAGSVAVLSTGDGVEHSEHATDDGPCRFVQMWLRSEGSGPVGYDVRAVSTQANQPIPIAQPRPDAVLWRLVLDGTTPVELPGGDLVHAYVVAGALLRSSLAEPLSAGDTFEMTAEPAHGVAAGVPTELLVWTFQETGVAPVLTGSDGGAWMAHSPGDDGGGDDEPPPPAGRITLMGDHGGAFLWDEEGCIAGGEGDREYLRTHLHLGRDLVDDLIEWGKDWDAGQAGTDEHGARGRILLERLRAECPHREFALRL